MARAVVISGDTRPNDNVINTDLAPICSSMRLRLFALNWGQQEPGREHGTSKRAFRAVAGGNVVHAMRSAGPPLTVSATHGLQMRCVTRSREDALGPPR